jgi:acetolactate synthase-1/2/3 large subunit
VFSVSGGPINPIYHACAKFNLPLIHTRHEAAACFMAEASSRVSGQAGAVVVTLGPGVTNTVTPALVAMMAGTPVIIIGAQASTETFERGAGMSWDPLPILQSVTKWSARVLNVQRIPEYLDIAWRKMWAGRPGPVFLEIPSNILSAKLDGNPAFRAPPKHSRGGLLKADRERLLAALEHVSRPLLLLGDELFWDRPNDLVDAVERHRLPFAPLRLACGIISETHPCCIGPGYAPANATLRQGMGEADCIMLIGHHFEFDLEFGSGIGPDATIVQISSDPDLLHRNRRAAIAVAASPSGVFSLLREAPVMALEPSWTATLARSWRAEREAQGADPAETGLHPVAVVDAVSSAAPENTIYVTSHGNVDFWADARLRLKEPGRYLRAGQSGALGAEVPYGLGASFADHDAPVVVFVGDGGVGYHVTELDTAERYGRAFVIVVLDDEQWGAIALPQIARYGESYEMALPRRDWTKVAQGLGCRGYLCQDLEAVKAAVTDALASKKPALIQVPVRSVISPYMDYISR